MSRLVLPHMFTLYSGPLTEAFRRGVAKLVVDNFFGSGQNHQGLPVALRWITTPALGIPRQPFNLFRRRNEPIDNEGLVNNVVINGNRIVRWNGRGMVEVEFNARPDAGRTLEVEALDWYDEAIPGQKISFDGVQAGLLRSPGIVALRVTGRGRLNNIRGLDQDFYANFDDWERIEVVGLPVVDEVASPAYETLPQGFEPPVLSGAEAGEIRLEIARLMHLPPPPSGVPGIPTPDWPPPDTGEYLFGNDGLAQLLPLVYKCLNATDDADPDNRQEDFRIDMQISGIQQTDGGAPGPGGQPADISLPVVGLALLAASGDNFAATGLGYGTTDFPPVRQISVDNSKVPPGTVKTAFDYMVTTEFNFVVTLLAETHTFKIELAALAQARPDPVQPASLSATAIHRNRAVARDDVESEAIRLNWNLSPFPQGYGVISSRRPGEVEVLNSPRRQAGGFETFLPQRPASVDGEMPIDTQTAFIDSASPVPLSGSANYEYLVAGLDVFGRWSSWRHVTYTTSAPPVGLPGLHSVTLESDTETLPDGTVTPLVLPDGAVSTTIEIVFSWDWFERRPDRVIFVGRFFPAGDTTAPAVSSGFAMRNVGSPGADVVVRFDPATEEPTLAPGAVGSVFRLLPETPVADEHADVRQYRLRISGLRCDFSAEDELAYVLYAQAAERVRPGELSEQVGPRVARIHDPLPPADINLPAEIIWTALPDATGRARGLLTWPPVPNAKGYVVWEATETALRHMLDPTLPPPPSGTTLVERATQLRDLLAPTAAQAHTAQAFARLNTALVRDNQIEVTLPAAADSIYVYQVTAVSRSNVEASRSNSLAFVAVPRLNVPGQPQLLVRKDTAVSALLVIALPGVGSEPAGFRVYRARSLQRAQEIGLMGPQKIELDDSGWLDHELPALNGGEPQRGRAIDDPVPQSWYPYYYRVVAMGREDAEQGQFRGQSIASAVQENFLPPDQAPLLDEIAEAQGSQSHQLLDTILVGARPFAIAANTSTNRIYVTNQNANTISLIDGRDNQVLATIPVGNRPSGVAVNRQTNRIYVTNSTSNAITIIDGTTNATTTRNIGGRSRALVVDERTNRIFIIRENGNRIMVVRGDSGTVAGTINTNRPSALAVNSEGERLYVANQTQNRLSVFNTSTNQLQERVTVGRRPNAVAYNAATDTIYVANRADGSLSVLDGTSHALRTTIDLPAQPESVTLDELNNHIYVGHQQGNTITLIDGASNSLLERIEMANDPSRLAVDPSQNRIYVTQAASNTVAVLAAGGQANNRVFSFRTDLPTRPTPLGVAQLELVAAGLDPLTGRVIRTFQISVAPYDVPQGPALTVHPAATPDELAIMPEIRRGQPDAEGRTTFTMRVRAADFADKTPLIICRDPLNRTAEAEIPEVE